MFAHIASKRMDEHAEDLVEPSPPDLPNLVLPLDELNPNALFQPSKKIDSPIKLRRELLKQRRLNARFLRNFAPKAESQRISVELVEFDWREQTEEDLTNFAGTLAGHGEWKKVSIPHYGPPLGRRVTYYRTTFDLTEEMLTKGSLFIRFKGVDYRAHAFVNDAYIGSHEGFFALFEFDFTRVAKMGTNVLLVKVENDAIFMGNDSWGEDGEKYEGDKLYAATGPGYDEPVIGWHHCPPGMGIYQSVFVEARPRIFISDVFVRPLLEESRAEAWVEVYSCHELRQSISPVSYTHLTLPT
ncbi:MAG: beta galactosidase jelly roll domain-containing protein, partial [Armatimonadetes bacterium]|nr:beta galactosidase jelly roll domain-containing protein [Armatimonadota bacterium]